MRRDACFDSTGFYRYALTREWDSGAAEVVFVMLNPSAADAERDDPTIRRCIQLARAWGYGRLRVVNLFAFRTADPRVLRRIEDPVGPENDGYLAEAANGGHVAVLAWGNAGEIGGRDRAVRHLFRGAHCLGITKQGQPRHPLYVPRDTHPVQLHDLGGRYVPASRDLT